MATTLFVPNEVHLSPTEMRVYDLLYRNRDALTTSQEIYELAISPGSLFKPKQASSYVYAVISRMRKKGIHIETDTGYGYRLEIRNNDQLK